jgi:hypothetical protein
VKLNTDDVTFYKPGKFIITAAVTSAFGALFATQVEFFRETIELEF